MSKYLLYPEKAEGDIFLGLVSFPRATVNDVLLAIYRIGKETTAARIISTMLKMYKSGEFSAYAPSSGEIWRILRWFRSWSILNADYTLNEAALKDDIAWWSSLNDEKDNEAF